MRLSRPPVCRWASFVAITLLLPLVLAPAARAGNFYWVGDNVNSGFTWNATTGLGASNWSSSPNFNASTGTTLPGPADNVFFYLLPNHLTDNVLGQSFTILSLNFASSATSPVTIGGGNTLTIGTGGLNVQQGSGAHTLTTAVSLGGVETWTNNSTNVLSVSGIIDGAAANNLTIAGLAGNGGFNFSGANTYSGSTTINTNGASLTLSRANGSIQNTSAITLTPGAILTLDSSAANHASQDRILDTGGITSGGGTINLIGNATAPTTETVGTLTLGTGQSQITVTPGAGQAATLTFGSAVLPSFARTTVGGALNFSGAGTVAAPNVALNGGGTIGGWATVGSLNTGGSFTTSNTNILPGPIPQTQYVAPGSATNVLDFATLNGTNVAAVGSAGATGTYTTNTAISTWTATQNINVSGTNTPTATTINVNSLYLTGNAIIGVATGTTYNLVVGSGGIISNQATGQYIVGGNFINSNSALIGGAAYSGSYTGGVPTYNGAATGNGNLNSHLFVPAGVPDLVVTTASNLQTNLVIGSTTNNAFGITKNGSGIWDIGGGNSDAITNTFTGKTTVNAGILLVRADTNFGAVPGSVTPDAITLNGGTILTTAGFTFNANRGITVGTNGGTLSYNGGATWSIGQKITGPGNLTIAAAPTSSGGATNNIRMSSAAGTNNYAGTTTYIAAQHTNSTTTNGVIQWVNNDQVPDLSALTLIEQFTAVTGFAPNGVGIMDSNGKTDTIGSLAGNAPVINYNGGFTTGGNNLSTTFSGSLVGTITATTGGAFTVNATAGTGSFTKTGTGTQTMSGPNNYSGATNVNGGKLLILGPNGSLGIAGASAFSTVTVTNAALGGSGTIYGPVIISSTGTLAPAISPTDTSTLTINNTLTINAGATFNYNFGVAGNPGVSDTVNVTGAVMLAAGVDTLNINALSGFNVGTYNLITAAAPITNNATFSFNGSTAFNYAVATSGSNLVLTVTPGNPTLTWTGSGSSTWQVGGPTNWFSSGAVAFANGNNVVFDDNGVGSPNVSVAAGGVSPSSMVFNQSVGTYTFSNGPITVNTATGGSGGITLQAGDVVFNNNVSSVTTTIQGGGLTIGASSTFSASNKVDVSGGPLTVNGSLTTPAVNVMNGTTFSGSGTITGSINYTSTANSTFPGVIAGAASTVSVNGTGTLTLTGANTYGGATTVSAGNTLLANNTTGSATGAGPVTVSAGATLGGSGFIVPNTGAVGTNTVSIAGTLSPGNSPGTLTIGSAAANATVTLSGTYNWEITGLGTPANPLNPANYGASSATAIQDRFTVNGTLDVTGSTLNVSASGSGFTGNNSYTWRIASTTGGLTAVPTLGTVTGDFNGFATTFSIASDANNLYLNFLAPSVWTGVISNAWTTPGNWAGGVVPATQLTALFNGPSPNTTVALGGAARPLKQLVYDSGNAAAYTIGTAPADALLFDAGGGIAVNSTVTTPQVIAAGLSPLGAMTVTNDGTGGLTINGNVTSGAGGTPDVATFAGAGTTTLAGTITAGSITQLTKNGAGVLNLSGNNTSYAAGVTANAGTLNINSPTAIGTGTLTLAGGALGNSTAGPVVVTTNNPIAMGNFGTSGTQDLNLGTGAVTLTADATATLGGTAAVTFGGSVSGSFSLTAAGAGTGSLNFTGSSVNFQNVTNSSTGTVGLGATGGTVSVLGNVTNSGAGAIVLNGTSGVGNAPTLGIVNSGAGKITLAGPTTTTMLDVRGGTVTQPDPNTYQFSVTGGIVQINPGVAVTAGNLKIAGTTSTSGQVLLAPGSSLTVGNPAPGAINLENVEIGVNTATTAPIGAVLAASGNATVSISAANITLGGNQSVTGNRTNVLVALGTGNNVLAANTSITVGASGPGGQDGDFTRSDNLGQALLVLGTGNNTITTGTLNISGQKSPGSVFIGNGPVAMTTNGNAATPVTSSTYAPPVPILQPNGTAYAQVTINNGGGSTAMILGNQNPTAATGTNSIGVLDTTGGILNGTFGTVTLGFNSFAPSSTHGGGIGSWVMGVANNAVTVDQVVMTNTPTATQGITGAVFSLNGGTVTFTAGAGGFVYGSTASFTNTNINLNGGTLNLNGNPIIDPAAAPLPLDSFGFNGGTLQNATAVFVTGGLVQNGGTIFRDQAGATTIGAAATVGSDVYTVGGGAVVQLNAGGASVALSAGSLARAGAGTLDIVPVTGNLDGAGAQKELVQFTATAPTPVNGILPAWIVARTNGNANASADFTTYNAAPNNSVGRFTGYFTGDLNTAPSTAVANPAGPTSLTTNPSVYALKLQNAVTDAGGHVLTIGAAGSPAGLILDGGSIAAGSLNFNNEAVIYTTAQNGTITAPITTLGDLTKFGPGRLILNSIGANGVNGGINVNAGTLQMNAPTNVVGGPVAVKNGGTLTGAGMINTSGANGVAFGPKATFAPGNGTSFGVLTITTASGNVTTATATTNPTSLTSAGLTFGLGISPTNVVGSVLSLNLGAPATTGGQNTGTSNGNLLGNLANGFLFNSSGGGIFSLDPITTVQVNANPANFSLLSYSYLVGTVPTGSSGAVTNLGNFAFTNGGVPFANNPTAASVMVSGNSVYLNFTFVPVPEPTMICSIAAAGFGLGALVRRRRGTRRSRVEKTAAAG